MAPKYSVSVLDVSNFSYDDRVTAAALQGLVNRDGPVLFLDYGIYDDPDDRTTNEDTMPEEIWQAKFRPFLGNQDRHNLDGYKKLYTIDEQPLSGLEEAVKLRPSLKGAVLWDPEIDDSINVALMYAALEDLLPIAPHRTEWAANLGLAVVHDLRGRWQDRVSLYRWAFENLFPRCTPGRLASIEPGWSRPEFIDYAVKEKLFTYSLSNMGDGAAFRRGFNLMALLLGGPDWLRNLAYSLGAFHPLKKLALKWMASDEECGLADQIQKETVAADPGAVIFGWHSCRDDEFAFLQLLSANGLRLVPSHLSSNFSFHSALPAVVTAQQEHIEEAAVTLEKDKIYLTFTYSDGDQLMLMNTGQIGGWRRPERGQVPFNWEMQPLLIEFAPALLGLYYSTVTAQDCLIAGPSGAGYVIPPLHDDLPGYLARSAEVCRRADMRVITSYYPDPPGRVIKEHLQAPKEITGYISGYFYLKKKPMRVGNGKAFICNAWPHLDQIFHSSDEVMAGVRELIEAPGPTPRFIGVHLFAYRTTVTDVYNFVQTLDEERVKVVRADEFLIAAKKHLGG